MERKVEIFRITVFLVISLTLFQANLYAAGNLLCDYGFELSEPNGVFPNSGCWSKYAPGYGGAGCTTTAARLGANGLWQYTGLATAEWQSQAFQDLPAAPGRRFFASAWVRTKFDDSHWVNDSRAFVKLDFLDADKNSLVEYSSRPVTDPNTDWFLLYFATYPAPPHTSYVRFALCVEKPQTVGQTIVNFDDCILREIECADCIRLDEIPACDGTQPLKGSVVGVNPDDYKVGVYIFVDDWWPKPTFDSPWTSIDSDGSWQCDISKTASDLKATEVMAFLVPNNEISDWPVNFDDPVGLPAIPGEAFRFPSVGSFRPSCLSDINFADCNWLVRDSHTRTVNPGNNYFDPDNAWVENNDLHLKITKDAEHWHCAEVFTRRSFGGGTFSFEVSNNIASLDPNVILGLFTWDEFAPHYSNREMDVELGRWGDPSGGNAQYVIQPWNKTGHLHKFNVDPFGDDSFTNVLQWGFNRVVFESYFGPIASSADNDLIDSWIYEANDVPRPGSENLRINLWLKGGKPLYDDVNVFEVVIKDFNVNPCYYEVSPLFLDFNSVLISKSATRSVSMTNAGHCLPYLVSVDIIGTDADYFRVAERAFSLEPGSSKQIDVAFVPDSARDYEASLQITGASGVVTVPLTASGAHIAYTRLPAVGTPDFLEGAVSGVRFSDYRVVSYIFVWDRWYIKPFWVSKRASSSPLVTITRQGAWRCDIDVEWSDKAATQVASFLVPKNSDYPPLDLLSLDDSRMSQYERISADKPKLTILSVKAAAGRAAGDDSIVIDGRYCINMNDMFSADRLCMDVLGARNTVWSLCVPFDPDRFISRDGFKYDKAGVHVRMKNIGRVQNSYVGTFRIVLDKADLTCLKSPVALTVLLGDFNQTAVADEEIDGSIINGRLPIPIQFLSGCTDAVRIDKLTLKNGTQRDSLYIKGAIVFKNGPPDLTMEDFSVGWGSDVFTVSAGSFKRLNSRTHLKYQCKKVKTGQSGVVTAMFDFKNHSFWLKISNSKLDTTSDNIAFNLVMGNFSRGVSVVPPR
jgi:hypothetical protein